MLQPTRNIAPGIYPDLSNEDYHASDGLSCSGLKKILESPAHYRAYVDQEFKQTPAMLEGELVHLAVLEPDNYAARVAVGPDVRANSREWKNFVRENIGKAHIKQEMHGKIQQIQASIFANIHSRKIVKAAGHIEESHYATDPRTGMLIKCRCDKRIPPYWDSVSQTMRPGHLVDLKTIATATDDKCTRAFVDLGYHIQAALYTDIVTMTTGETYGDMLFVFVGKEPPYTVCIKSTPPELLDLGRYAYRQALDKFLACSKLDQWPGAYPDITPFELSRWQMEKLAAV